MMWPIYSVVGIVVVRHHDAFGENVKGHQYSFEDTMTMLLKQPLLTLKQEYFNDKFRIVNNSHIHFKCDVLFQHVIDQDLKKSESCEELLTNHMKDIYALHGYAKFLGGCSNNNVEIQNGSNKTWEWPINYIKESGNRK